MVDSANISSGQGLGAAQVFEPYKSQYGAEVAKIGQAKRKEENDRQNDVYGDLGKVKADGIFFKHQPIFAEKQKELYDWTRDNIDKLRKGDSQATIDFHQKLTQLGTDIGQSKNVAESYTQAGKEYMADPNKYRPEVLDKLHGFEGYNKETGQFQNIDPSIMEQTVDLNKYTKDNIAPVLKEQIVKLQKATPQGNGVVFTKETETLAEDVKKNTAMKAITDPHVYGEIHYQMQKQNPGVEPTKEDIANYYYENHLKGLFPDVLKEQRTQGFAPKEGSGTILGLSDIKKNVPIAIHDATTGKDVQDVSPAGITLPTDLNLNIPAHGGIISSTSGREIRTPILDENGQPERDENDKVKTKPYVGQIDITGGGDVNIGKRKTKGKSEYGVFLYAKGKTTDGQDVNVVVPINDVKGYKGISQQGEVIAALEKQADDLNKKTDITPEAWQKKWDALKVGQSIVGLDGKTYIKK